MNDMENLETAETQLQILHAEMVAGGLETEEQANESDDYARRVLGMEEPEAENYDGPEFVNGRCTCCHRRAEDCYC